MKWLALVLTLIPATAYATQSSVLCKATDANEYIDIVSKGENTNEVLVQIGGGEFFDAMSSFDNPVFKVYIPFDTGAGILIYNVNDQKGVFGVVLNGKRQTRNITCKFR